MVGSQLERHPAAYTDGAVFEKESETGPNESDLADLSTYIADMSGELAALAGRSGMPMLAYFLNLARAEAEMQSREFGGARIERKR